MAETNFTIGPSVTGVDSTFTVTSGATTSGTNTGDQNLFSTIAVSGQSDVVADTTSDTLTFVAGTNMTITTTAGSDSITFNSTAGGGGTPTAITVANEGTDTTCFPAFFTAASGDLGPKSNASFTFNSNTGNLSCTTFTGALVGNVTGNVTGSSGSCTGNAATVTTNANLTGDITSSGNATTADVTLITGKTNKASPVAGSDYVLIYDAAGTALKKALISSIQGGGAGGPSQGVITCTALRQFSS